MTEKKRKTLYWTFKLLSILVSCAFPIFAICEKYPVWEVAHGASRSALVGIVLILIVVLIVFRRTVFTFIRDKCKLKHAPPITVWFALLIVAYVMVFIGDFMLDMVTVLWMGIIGCVIGTVLTYISERFGKEKDNG